MARKRWRGVSRKRRSEAMRQLALKRWRTRTVQPEADRRAELERLIRLRFPPQNKAERVARGLAALYQEPGTRLSKAQWKRIADADVEDQY
jgi:hypothetical protein